MQTDTSETGGLSRELNHLGKQADEIRALIETQRSVLAKAGLSTPPSLVSNLSQFSQTLKSLGQRVSGLEQEVRQLQALAKISQVVNSSLDLSTVLNQVMDTLIHLTGAERGFLMLRNEHGQLDIRVARNVDRSSLSASEWEISRTVVERVAREGVPVVTTNAQEDPRFERHGSVIGYRLQSILCVPLKVKGQLTGVIYADNRAVTGLFTERERDLLNAFANQAAVALENARLFNDLTRAYDATLEGWVKALDLRDKETEGHTRRVTEMTVRLALAMGATNAELIHIYRGALLHDIGKLAIPDSILLKPGPLTDEELEIMRRHPQYAYDMLYPIVYLRPAIDIPFCHHEKWDGTGYPRGLKGDEIPVAARMFSIADVWDALRSERPYHEAWPEDKIRDHLRTLSGTHFDPRVATAFMDLKL